MRKALSLALFIALILLSACKSGAEFRVINRTSFPAYVALDDGEIHEIDGQKEHIFKVDTDTQNFFTGEVSRKVKVYAAGQTYALIDDISRPQQDTTTVTLKAGKTLNAYLHPNRACVQIKNLSDSRIYKAEIWLYRHYSVEQQLVCTIYDIFSGEEEWVRVRPMSTESGVDSFYYTVAIYPTENSSPIYFGDSENILRKDERFVVEWE